MKMRTLDELEPTLDGVRVFVRVDFNVPIDGGRVADTTRLEAALPTIEELRSRGARILLASHRGRPKGEPDPELSLEPVVPALEQLLGASVRFASDCVGAAAEEAAGALADGEVALLENLRFHAGEKANDLEMAGSLASLAHVYVNDAFGTAHRAHASVVGVARVVASQAAGRLMVREVETLSSLLNAPQRPFVAVVGGAKIEGKVDTLVNLLPRLDVLALGGGMANTFLAAQGCDMRGSLVEEDRLDVATKILERAEAQDTQIVLPEELVVTDDLENPERVESAAAREIPSGMMAVDVGEAFCASVAQAFETAGTVFWNGPLGVFEKPPFDRGTVRVAEALSTAPGFSVIGGGETVAAVRRAGVADRIGHVSTGGGASLELLAGRALPGVEVLQATKEENDG